MRDIAIRLHYDSPDGPLAADLTADAAGASLRDNRHGNASFSLRVRTTLPDAFRVYIAAGRMWVVMSRGAELVWVGRVHEPSLFAGADGAGVVIRALGRWPMLDDLRYTALWSDASVTRWEVDDQSGTQNPRHEIDTNNRLYIALKKGENYQDFTAGSPQEYALLRYFPPDRGARQITNVAFDYDVNMYIDFVVELMAYDDGYASGASIWSLTTTGSTQSGTQSITLGTPKDFLALRVYNNSGGTATPTADTGDDRAILTDLRVRTTTSTSVTADLIVSDLATRYAALNSGVLASATPVSTSPGLDLTDVVYEDAAPTAILEELGLWGDGAGTLYTPAVTADGFVTFLPAGTGGRTWEVDAEDLELTTSLDAMANSVYAVYEDAGGRTLRTAAATSAESAGRYGYTRQQHVGARTTSAATAEAIRDAALSDTAFAPGAADIAVRRVFSPGGAIASLLDVRPGDTLLIRDLPLFGDAADLDRLRSFRVAEREYRVSPERLTVTPEEPLPRLDVLLAQREAGTR